jgi:hypothetical protein
MLDFAIIAIAFAAAGEQGKVDGETPLLRATACAATALLLLAARGAVFRILGASVERILVEDRGGERKGSKLRERENEQKISWPLDRTKKNEKNGKKKPKTLSSLFLSLTLLALLSPLSSPNSGPPPAPERRRRATLSAMNSRPAALRCRAAAAGASAKAAPMVSIRRPVAAIAPMVMQQSKLSSAVSPLLQRKQQRLQPLASPPTATSAAAAAASSGEPPAKKSTGFVADRVAGLKALATPFSDPVSNGRLVALCLAQMLCSVATLIHDT